MLHTSCTRAFMMLLMTFKPSANASHLMHARIDEDPTTNHVINHTKTPLECGSAPRI